MDGASRSRRARRGRPRPTPTSGRSSSRAARSSAQGTTSAPARTTPRWSRCERPGARAQGRDALRHARAVQPRRPDAALHRRHRGAGVARVVVGCRDPNPHVLGRRGREAAGGRRAGRRRVPRGRGRARLIAPWTKFVTTGMPYVTLKLGLSLDGRIASRTGASKWVTGPEARARVHVLRAQHDAVVVGIGTALADDPRLTVRDAPGPEPPARHLRHEAAPAARRPPRPVGARGPHVGRLHHRRAVVGRGPARRARGRSAPRAPLGRRADRPHRGPARPRVAGHRGRR